MKRIFSIFSTLILLTFCSCNNIYMDELSAIHNDIDELYAMLEKANSNIDALQTIVNALQEKDFVTSVTPIIENGTEIGYTIAFSKSGVITIYHGKDGQNGKDGKDGKDGYTPQIGISQDSDGIYYWTLDGNWMTGTDGEKLRAIGHNGEPGQDAVTPQLKIVNDYWYISYDNGLSWSKLGKATGEDGKDGQDGKDGKDGEDGKDGQDGKDGEDGKDGQDGKDGKDGDSMFRDVIINTYEIIFITSDGTEFMIPRYTNVRIYFDIANDETGILPGREIVVNYTLENATEETFVTASSDGLYTARVEADDLSHGRIYVRAPYKSEYGHINVLVSDGKTYSFVKVINFYEHRMEFPNGLEYYVSSHGGEIQIPFSTNFQYRFEVEGSAEEWISIDYHETRSEMRDGILTVNVAMNDYEYARMGRIWVIPTNSTGDVYAEIIINQSSAYFSIDQSKYAVPVEGARLTTHITSSRGLKLHIPSYAASWLTSLIEDHGGDEYTVTTIIPRNETALIRAAAVDLYSGDGSIYLGALEFVQSSPLVEEISDMIFKVRANWSNDFTAILPIAGYYDCYIDWGDGQAEYIFGGDEWAEHENAGISHRYDVQSPTTFTVRISGTVTSLDSEGIKAPCITEVVQWGKTNLSYISGAFWGNYLLEKVCADPFNALGNIGNLDHIFYRCSSLETIPEDIFDKCVNAYSAYSTFQECTGLKEIPENLFKNCKNLTYMDQTFSDCKGLTAIPENLFADNLNLINLSHVFNGCSNIKSIPSGLFNHNHALENINWMFHNCDGITSIPEDLFYNTVSARSFEGAFYGCDSLTTIPEGLFRNNIDVTNFNHTFRECRALKTVPVGIFDNNRKVTEFSCTFGWDYELTGESPYTIINGVKYHLYERHLNPDHFVKPANYEYCFAECYYLIEWESMQGSRWFNSWQ